MLDEIKAYGGTIVGFGFLAVILSRFFGALELWRPARGEFGYGLWYLLLDVDNSALSLVSLGVAGAALIVLGLLAWNQFYDPW